MLALPSKAKALTGAGYIVALLFNYVFLALCGADSELSNGRLLLHHVYILADFDQNVNGYLRHLKILISSKHLQDFLGQVMALFKIL
jgi:hypothetical protein